MNFCIAAYHVFLLIHYKSKGLRAVLQTYMYLVVKYLRCKIFENNVNNIINYKIFKNISSSAWMAVMIIWRKINVSASNINCTKV